MTEIHPFKPYIPEKTKKLIIGTIPPERFSKNELFKDDVNFYYGSRDNSFWELLKVIFDVDFLKINNIEEIPQPISLVHNLTKILNIVSAITEIPKTAIFSSSKKPRVTRARGIFTYVAVKYAGFDNREISNLINKDPSGVTHMVSRIEDLKRENLSLSSMLDKVIQQIQV